MTDKVKLYMLIAMFIILVVFVILMPKHDGYEMYSSDQMYNISPNDTICMPHAGEIVKAIVIENNYDDKTMIVLRQNLHDRQLFQKEQFTWEYIRYAQ